MCSLYPEFVLTVFVLTRFYCNSIGNISDKRTSRGVRLIRVLLYSDISFHYNVYYRQRVDNDSGDNM